MLLALPAFVNDTTQVGVFCPYSKIAPSKIAQ